MTRMQLTAIQTPCFAIVGAARDIRGTEEERSRIAVAMSELHPWQAKAIRAMG